MKTLDIYVEFRYYCIKRFKMKDYINNINLVNALSEIARLAWANRFHEDDIKWISNKYGLSYDFLYKRAAAYLKKTH